MYIKRIKYLQYLGKTKVFYYYNCCIIKKKILFYIYINYFILTDINIFGMH